MAEKDDRGQRLLEWGRAVREMNDDELRAFLEKEASNAGYELRVVDPSPDQPASAAFISHESQSTILPDGVVVAASSENATTRAALEGLADMVGIERLTS